MTPATRSRHLLHQYITRIVRTRAHSTPVMATHQVMIRNSINRCVMAAGALKVGIPRGITDDSEGECMWAVYAMEPAPWSSMALWRSLPG